MVVLFPNVEGLGHECRLEGGEADGAFIPDRTTMNILPFMPVLRHYNYSIIKKIYKHMLILIVPASHIHPSYIYIYIYKISNPYFVRGVAFWRGCSKEGRHVASSMTI